MKFSFKYRFILSFITIEILFISLIVFFNFSSLNKLSHNLIKEKIETGTKLFTELIKTPLIVYDLGTLDNAIESFMHIKNIASVKIIDNQNRVISYASNSVDTDVDIFDKDQVDFKVKDRTFRLSRLDIKIDGEKLGSAKIVFELTESLKTIEYNRELTFTLVLLEILVSIVIAYIIGSRLTNALNQLTVSAQSIAKDDQVLIPNLNTTGYEISVLSNALHLMQERISERNSKLKEVVKDLQNSTKLLEKERDFHSVLIDSASSLIFVMNTKGEIIISNKAVENLTGYTHSELQGVVVWEVFIPENTQAEIQDVFSSLISGNFPSTYENLLLIRDGSTIPIAWSNSCTVDENGNVEYIIAIGIDMTERNKIDQTIRALLNSPIDSIILTSMDGTIVEINEVAAKHFNSDTATLKGRKISGFLPESITNDRVPYYDKLLATKEQVIFEESYDGLIFEVHLYPILDKNERITEISIFSRDITEIKKAQNELESYMKIVDENVITSYTDKRGIIKSSSKAFCKISGYTMEELIGQAHSIVRHPDMPSSLYKELWETIKRGEIWHGEVKNRSKNGSFYWVDVTIYPDYDEDGNINGYYAIREDITNKKLLEELSITDSLTTLYNRRYFDKIFDDEINRAKRDKKIFCLLFLDVDNFKLYNDTYGHQMGDSVLESIGKIMKKSIKRSGDFVFRLGGEEFAAIYSVNSEDDIDSFANKMCRAIEDEKIEHKANTASSYVTASFGVISLNFIKNRELSTNVEELYKIVDTLLYEAKEQGRNRVILKKL